MKRRTDEHLNRLVSRRLFMRLGGIGTAAAALPLPVAATKPPQQGTAGRGAIPAEAERRRQARLAVMQTALGRRPADLVIQN